MLEVVLGSVFDQDCDAIVNPANQSLLAGSGLCGVIHKLAGPELEIACKKLGRQEIGDAVITPAFNLKNCQYIIHACGPRWLDGTYGERELLAKTYKNIIDLANAAQLKKIAIPAISTGIYKFPIEQSAEIAIENCISESSIKLDLNLIISDPNTYRMYTEVYKYKFSI